MAETTYGHLRFQTVTAFNAALPRTDQDFLQEALAALSAQAGTPKRPPPITDWSRIKQCIQRGTLVLLTAETPAFRASLQFDPADPRTGTYEIHFPTQRRNEAGRVLSVSLIDEKDLYQRQYAMLAPFPMRYIVVTRATDRQGTQQIWLVGISHFRSVSPTELATARGEGA